MIRADDGHGVVDGILTPAEMRDVLQQLSHAALERTKAGARHLLRLDVVRQLADDPRILSLARQFVGAAATPFRAALFDKSPAANWLVAWHQDTALPLRRKVTANAWGPWSTKAGVLYAHAPAWALEQVVALRVSLDDSTKDNGPLRVLPDTHRLGLLTDSQIQALARERQSLDCLASCGGIVVMRPLTVHASSKSIVPQSRRVLHIEYAAAIDLGSGIELAVA
jgi:ectoine hydroxylase-related dioxygenase (phytanoyl-CoA dioxygenase family)